MSVLKLEPLFHLLFIAVLVAVDATAEAVEACRLGMGVENPNGLVAANEL